MATVEVTLKRGLILDKDGKKEHQKKAVLREASAGDFIDATLESEHPVLTPDGYELMASPTAVGLNTLRRQIVSIGEIQGPLSVGEIKKLSVADLELLQTQAEKLETASQAVAQRGRDPKAKSGSRNR